MIHELKELPLYFDAVRAGKKSFELRKADRDFRVGDYLALNEWTEKDGYTGRSILAKITYALYIDQIIGANVGFEILGIQVVRIELPDGGPFEYLTSEPDNLRSEVHANG